MKNSQELPLPPGNFGLPFIGETINFLTESDFADRRQSKYGNIFKTKIFGRPTITLIGAEANRFLFSNENKFFVATWPKSVATLLGPASLSIQSASFHTSRRKLLSQAFQPRALAGYIPIIEAITTSYLKKWEKMGELTWYPQLRNYTLDIACKLFVGLDNGSQTRLGEIFEIWGGGLFTLPIPLPITKYGKALNARKELLKEIETIIKQRQKSDDLGTDALTLLLQARDEEGNCLPLDELKDQILLLLFAGHETLTSALASFCLLMSQYPQVCTNVREELKRFDLSSSLTIDSLKQFTYLEQVLKEVLRFIPPVGGGFRKVIQECSFNGYRLPTNWIIQYQIGKTHTDQNIYNDPNSFDPDRFSPERAEDKKQTFAHIPFGGGLRECLGKEFARLEIKIFAIRLVQNYAWNLLPNQDITMTVIPTPHPRDGLKVKIFNNEQ